MSLFEVIAYSQSLTVDGEALGTRSCITHFCVNPVVV